MNTAHGDLNDDDVYIHKPNIYRETNYLGINLETHASRVYHRQLKIGSFLFNSKAHPHQSVYRF